MTAATPRAELDAVLSRGREIRTHVGTGEMVWRAWGPEDNDRPPLVLLHGGSGAWNHWVRTIPALEPRYRMLVADLPGCGDSDDPPKPYDAASLATLVSAGIDGVLPGVAPFDLVSFSFGGVLSGLVAHGQARRIRSLTLIGAPILGLTGTGPANDLVEVPRDLPPDRAAPLYRRNLQNLMFGDPAAADDLAVAIQAENMAKARLRSRGIARSRVLADSLKELPCRLGCIFGERDATLDSDLAANRAYVAEIHPVAAFHVVPGAGHWVQFEASDAVNALLPTLID